MPFQISARRSPAMVAPPRTVACNNLLAALPFDVQARLQPRLERVLLAPGAFLHVAGQQLTHMYFPTSAVVSLLCAMADGDAVETSSIGNEGAIGIALFMGGGTTDDHAVVQIGGDALRLDARTLLAEFQRGGPLQALLLRYTRAQLVQVSQAAVCNRLHQVERRLCRWLLCTHDRLSTDELQLTQEFIARMLGVRREGVTAAAQHLQEAGIISHARGRITILDRPGLEAAACECYRVVRDELDRLIGPPRRLIGTPSPPPNGVPLA